MLTQFLENYPIDLTMNPALDFWKSACMLIISGDNCYETCCRPKKIVFRIWLSNLWHGKFTSWLPRNWFELSVTLSKKGRLAVGLVVVGCSQRGVNPT